MAEFRMPSLGADMEAGTLVEWLVHPGDVIHRGDVVAVVDTDKAAIEVECFADGVVGELVVAPGQRVPVGTVLATIEAADGAAAPVPPVVAEPPLAPPAAAPVAEPTLVTSPLVRQLAEDRGVDLAALAGADATAGHVIHRADVERAAARPRDRRRVSPRARRLAAEAGVDLETITGTGHGGAITAADVERARSPVPAATAPKPAAEPGARTPSADHADSMRQAIAALMERSNREIPHYYLSSTIDCTAATAWLRERNRALPVEQRLVPAALLLKATALAARAVGALNGSWVDGNFRAAERVDLGLIVSLRRGGILVPVIADAPNRSVPEIMAMTRDYVTRARTGKLRASELSPPTITVSNLGDQGVDSVLGVIYPPQVALVGFGAVQERPWAVDGMLAVRPLVTATLAADHRASDGAVGARLLNHIADLLQKPEEL